MTTPTREELIQRWQHQRGVLQSLVTQAEPHREHEIYRGWRLKELLAHMSGWDDAVVDALRAHARDEAMQTPASRGINAYNAQTVSTRETLDYEHVRREWERTHELVIQTIRSLPEQKVQQPLIFPWGQTGTVAELVNIFVEHEEEHAGHLREWLNHPNTPFAEEH